MQPWDRKRDVSEMGPRWAEILDLGEKLTGNRRAITCLGGATPVAPTQPPSETKISFQIALVAAVRLALDQGPGQAKDPTKR